ncbi:hypothetical protein PV963_36935 [Streptomyces coeruleorubidus]|uniref:hypothetical protein n=1 Tax=Streptomyces coeruleorubidus TaxID=116188 RepID=UPI00237EF34C|nr:hypothetical protein [Streptomyces coeruleorubidus]WDV55543.1 hypothetical protein PV963_36935 [Streptomyces coeruleorubidus]
MKRAQTLSRLPKGLREWSEQEFLRIRFTEVSEQVLEDRLGTIVDETAEAVIRGKEIKRDGLTLLLRGVTEAVAPKGFRVRISQTGRRSADGAGAGLSHEGRVLRWPGADRGHRPDSDTPYLLTIYDLHRSLGGLRDRGLMILQTGSARVDEISGAVIGDLLVAYPQDRAGAFALAERSAVQSPDAVQRALAKRHAATFSSFDMEELRGSRLLPTLANGSPAFGQYRPSATGTGFEPWALQVVDISGDRITDIHAFRDTERLFPPFNLPHTSASRRCDAAHLLRPMIPFAPLGLTSNDTEATTDRRDD